MTGKLFTRLNIWNFTKIDEELETKTLLINSDIWLSYFRTFMHVPSISQARFNYQTMCSYLRYSLSCISQYLSENTWEIDSRAKPIWKTLLTKRVSLISISYRWDRTRFRLLLVLIPKSEKKMLQRSLELLILALAVLNCVAGQGQPGKHGLKHLSIILITDENRKIAIF